EAALEKGEEAPDRQEFFRVIPGAECYVVDDERGIVTNGKGQPVQTSSYVVFDLETTGFSPRKNRIIEIGAVRIENGNVTERFSEFVNPRVPLPYKITQLTGITDTMVADASGIEEVLPRFVAFCEGAVLVGHNVSFDISFINENCARQGIEADFTTVDTLGLSRMFFPRQARHTLDAVAKALNVTLGQHHRAVDDAEATAGIFLKFLAMLAEKQAETLDDVNRIGRLTKEAAKHLRPHHVTVLAKNTLGRVNLYTLVSESHLNYFYRYPLVPASLLREYREGLILGSADAHGDLFDAVMEDRSGEEIARIVSFYDYLEVQPPENYFYMIESGRYESVESEEDIREIIRRIVKLGEQYGKPVCATSDAHFLDPEAETFRSVLVEGKDIKGGKNAQTEQKGVKKDDAHAPLYLRTTREMLDAFAFLGEEKAREIVIENPHKILDMCDSVSPVRPDKCPPVIADSDKTLRKICYEKAHAIYGDPLPEIVEKRLEKELTSIIGNGFAVMYIIAQKLVWKSLEDGYIVGSRGSVGSSFVAFAAGITEVNALPPHYVCPKCKYSDFESDDVLSYAGNSGCDMPDRVCPVCGEKLYKDGFDIPFETFLGFHGEKEPDIDLNFSGEYQATAHRYTEEIFGKGQTYRAGTVSALQDKTAYGVVRKYLDYNHIVKRRAEVDRIVQGLSGVRHGTGQHPGGIIVLPIGEDINSFTPIQHPANKSDTDTVTTHYDYHSIDHNLLKLDILGHDDPTMVRFLFDATGIDPTKAPLDDPAVMQLFIDTSSLGIEP
ncbi:MAG: PolC-type DNA polymerase III, partial [Butyrivibrio sp.]|nr:PolC-type DNA polymerase III [Butyrivibrio sp.]